ncbi:MAG: hypothetical protein OXF04_05475 [bacterium]|nr:hypothetical protein [bacterium]
MATAVLLRVTLAAPEVCPAYSPGDGQASIDAGADWIVRTQAPSGRYLYEYDRRTSSAKPGYNLVRHAGGTMSLYQLAIVQQGRNHQVVEAADRGMNYLLERAVDTGDGAMGPALSPRGPVKTGTAALTLVSLAHRRILTGDSSFDQQMRSLGRFLIGQQLPSTSGTPRPAHRCRGSVPGSPPGRPPGDWRFCTRRSPARAGTRRCGPFWTIWPPSGMSWKGFGPRRDPISGRPTPWAKQSNGGCKTAIWIMPGAWPAASAR